MLRHQIAISLENEEDRSLYLWQQQW